MIYDIKTGARKYHLDLSPVDADLRTNKGRWRCRIGEGGREFDLDAAKIDRNTLSLVIEGKSYTVYRECRENEQSVWVGRKCYKVELDDPRSWRGRKKLTDNETGPVKLIASMPGKVVRILVAQGDEVQAGHGILVVEAMKMQNEIKSPRAGVAREIMVAEGTNVNAGDTLAVIE